VLCFGWFMHPLFRMRHDFPLHGNLRPIFVSFHCNKRGLLTPEAIARRDQSFGLATEPMLAGIRLAGERRETTPSTQAHGMFIEWGEAIGRI
jgi:hypothetical protein